MSVKMKTIGKIYQFNNIEEYKQQLIDLIIDGRLYEILYRDKYSEITIRERRKSNLKNLKLSNTDVYIIILEKLIKV